MKKILRIARTELSIMFYSPIAWIVMILFFIQCGLIFTDLLYSQETNQQLERPLSVLSKVLFAGEDGILAKVQQYLYLYIPILTMGLFSREKSSGSIKLLLSSPVTAVQMVLGKFGSMMVYCFLLALILASFILTAHFSIIELDIPFIIGGILGIYLLMLAYAAIGMFMSSLTSYQIVAVISTLAVLAGLNYVGSIGQQYDLVRNITYWVSISGRADNMVNGLISSKDIIYFLLVIALFVCFTIFKFINERSSASKAVQYGKYIGVLILVVVIGYISSLPGVNQYYDTTRFKDRTLTKNSQEIIDRLGEPIDITTYVNLVHYSARNGSPENRIKDLHAFEMYRRFIPEMKMKYIYYYDTISYDRDTTLTLKEKALKAADALKFDFDEVLTPEQIQKRKNLKPENNRLVRFVSYKGDTTALRMFDDIFQYPQESEISAALKRLLEGPAKVGIINGHGERDIVSNANGSYRIITRGVNIRGSLMNQGFQTNYVDLKEEIPDSLEVLVLADPHRPLDSLELERINKYIDAGGDMLIAGDPGRQQYLNPVLKKLGVQMEEGTVLQKSEDYQLDLVQAKLTPQASAYGFSFYKKAVVGMSGVSPITVKEKTSFNVSPLLKAQKENTWVEESSFDLEKENPEFDKGIDNKVTKPLAVILTRKKDSSAQKIIVVGDADFMSNAEMTRHNLNTINSSLVVRMFRLFSEGSYPVNTARPRAIDTKIKLKRPQIEFLKIFYAAIIPLIIGLIAAIILVKRKRK